MRYYPDKTGTAPLVTQLCQDLVLSGADVTVIASLPHYGRQDVHPDYRHYQGVFHRSNESGVNLIRTPVFLPRNQGLLQRAFNYLSYNLSSLIVGFQVEKPDVILAVNPPITTTFTAWIISLLRGAPLVVGIQDVWPECVIRVGKLTNPLLIILSEFLEKVQYRIAHKVIVLSAGMRQNLAEKSVPEEKIEVIANWADTGVVQPGQKENEFFRKHDLAGKFVILFSGNHGYISALENILYAAELLSNDPEILFILAGEGSVKSDLIKLAKDLGLKNLLFLPTQSEQDWLEMLAACDLALVPLRADLAGLNVPSKTYTLMAAARPILASVPAESEIAHLIVESGAGMLSKPEDPADLAAKITSLKNDPGSLEEFGQKGREYLLANYNRQKQTEHYYQVLKSAVGKE